MESLRHAGRGNPLFASEKRDGAWILAGNSPMFDLSGGPLAQHLVNLQTPDARHFANISAPGGLETPLREELEAEVLRRAGPDVSACLWASSGSDSVELAIWAVAFALLQKDPSQVSFIVRQGSYHGSTLLTRSLSTRSRKSTSADQQGIVGRMVLPEPQFRGAGGASISRDYIAELERLPLDGSSILLLESAPTTGADFWPGGAAYAEILACCHERRLPVIFDEVAAGAYRHGWFSAFDWGGPHPPAAVVLGKGLTSGSFPLTCVLLRHDLAEAIVRSGLRPPAFTYGLNSDAAAATALQCLRRFDSLATAGALEKRRATVADHAERLRQSDGSIRIENTDTTIRVGVFDQERAAVIRRAFRERGLLVYENTTIIEDRQIAFFLACPYLDLSDDCAAGILGRFAAAVLAA